MRGKIRSGYYFFVLFWHSSAGNSFLLIYISAIRAVKSMAVRIDQFKRIACLNEVRKACGAMMK